LLSSLYGPGVLPDLTGRLGTNGTQAQVV